MIPHVQRSFPRSAMDVYSRAVAMVRVLPDAVGTRYPEIRCHELAHAAAFHLGMPVVDGRVGIIEHSWLWTRQPTDEELALWPRPGWAHEDRPRILDLYVPGVVPQVQLIDTHVHLQLSYWPDDTLRGGMDREAIEIILDTWKDRGL